MRLVQRRPWRRTYAPSITERRGGTRGFVAEPRGLGRLLDVAGPRDRAGHRQRRVHLDPGGQAARGAPGARQALARRLGLGLALVMRILLLLSLSWVIGLTAPLFTVVGQEISGRDVILILGGLFLLGKSTYEIHENLEGEEGHSSARVRATFGSVLVQIVILDLVFSLDSVITAVGMVNEIPVMIAAVTIAILVMLVSAEAVAGLVNRHPTLKMLALSFLLLIGFALLLEGFDHHVPKGYIYFAMGFSVFVELLNICARRRRQARSHPVELHRRYARSAEGSDR